MSLSIQPKHLEIVEFDRSVVWLLNLSMLHFMWMNFASGLSIDKLRYRIPSRVTKKKINPHNISRRFLNLHTFGTFDFLNCIGVTFYLFKIRVWCDQIYIYFFSLCHVLTKSVFRHIFRICIYLQYIDVVHDKPVNEVCVCVWISVFFIYRHHIDPLK